MKIFAAKSLKGNKPVTTKHMKSEKYNGSVRILNEYSTELPHLTEEKINLKSRDYNDYAISKPNHQEDIIHLDNREIENWKNFGKKKVTGIYLKANPEFALCNLDSKSKNKVIGVIGIIGKISSLQAISY